MSLHLPELRRTMRELDGVGHRAAFASLRVGDAVGALERLERSRSQELASALQAMNVGLNPNKREEVETLRTRLREIERLLESGAGSGAATLIHEARRLRQELAERAPLPHQQTLAELLSERPDFVFLAPIITPAGAELIVARGGCPIGVWPLAGPELSHRLNEALAIWLRGVFALQRSDGEQGRGGRFDLVVDTMAALETDLIGPLRAAIQKAEIGPDASFVLTLPGKVAILPVGWAGGERSLTGTMNLRLAPSIRSFLMDRAGTDEQQEPTLVAIANPTGDLPFADFEVAFAADLFGAAHATVLDEAHGSAEAVLAALRTSSHWLFATHGHFNSLDPKLSSIRVGRESELTIGQILASAPATAPQLVVLSACDSAVHDVDQAPDEFFGLMGAFMQLGARTVVGNLWPVSDVAASVLTTRMFHNIRSDASDTAIALREAPRWLQQASGNEIASWIEAVSTHGPELDKHSRWASRLRSFGEQPVFVHPYYWAGLVAYGR